MRPASRLFQIILLLRRGQIVTARQIADELEVSLRTIYRDIRTLMMSGVPIEGEAGVGYFLRREFYLPPLMFTEAELQALAWGAQMLQASEHGDLAKALDQALTKIEITLPDHLKTVFKDKRHFPKQAQLARAIA
jgi:predicted DNA-binding transcriptional regulator YafY